MPNMLYQLYFTGTRKLLPHNLLYNTFIILLQHTTTWLQNHCAAVTSFSNIHTCITMSFSRVQLYACSYCSYLQLFFHKFYMQTVSLLCAPSSEQNVLLAMVPFRDKTDSKKPFSSSPALYPSQQRISLGHL